MKKSHYVVLVSIFVLTILSFLAGRHSSKSQSSETAGQRRVLYYVDPMHPAYKSDKPGIAPDCGMKLEPVYEDGAGAPDREVADVTRPAGAVSINAEQQQLIGLRLATVEKTSGTRNVRLLGKVAADEERTYRLAAGTDGNIEETFGSPTGTLVKKDQKLASFVSQDFLTAEQTYLTSLVQAPQYKSEVVNEPDWRNQTAKLAYGRLRALGMSEAQLKQLATTRAVSDEIDIVSPVDGFVVSRNVASGQWMEKGAELYRITDLSRVVIYADAFENEAQYFRPGIVAKVMLPNANNATAGKTLRATVSKVLPQFDGVTRTMKVRLEVENPGFVLRPDMFVDVELPVPVPAGLSVPADALLDSGVKKRVFVERGSGWFEPREVETGPRVGDQVQIVKGLAAGERVVVSGTFLVDSESRLRATSAGVAGKPEDVESGRNTKVMNAAMPGMPMPSDAKAVDPKCGMEVDPAKSVAAGLTVSHKGKTYYFCSKSCKEEFAANPEKFLASGHAGAMQ